MRIIGISPLTGASAACLVEDGHITAAMQEEWLTLRKHQRGFPQLALQELFNRYTLTPETIDAVAYAALDARVESEQVYAAWQQYQEQNIERGAALFRQFRHLPKYRRTSEENPKISWYRQMFYAAACTINPLGRMIQERAFERWFSEMTTEYEQRERELLDGLERFGLREKLTRVDYHDAHAAAAYFLSGCREALIISLGGHGGGIAGRVALGRDGSIEPIHELAYPADIDECCQMMSESPCITPANAADATLLSPAIRAMFEVNDGDIRCHLPHHPYFFEYLAARYPHALIAAACQSVMEEIVGEYVGFYVRQTGQRNLILAGKLAMNMRLSRHLAALPDIDAIFVAPTGGDESCGIGAALSLCAQQHAFEPYRLQTEAWGTGYTSEEIAAALIEEGLDPEKPEDAVTRLAELLADGKIIARFDGRMEYRFHASGNRALLFAATASTVPHSGMRTCFLLADHAEKYLTPQKIELSNGLFALNFEATAILQKQYPAAINPDGMIYPQIIRKESHTEMYALLDAYYRLTGHPLILSAPFALPGEPVVCTPYDAIRAFKFGQLSYLAMGAYLIKGLSVE